MSEIEIFDSISTKENTTITNNNQSIFLAMNCGCKLVQHFYCGNTRSQKGGENINLMNERSLSITLCKNHKLKTNGNIYKI
jgi:hypothetical protein